MTPLNKRGKRFHEWEEERAKLIKEALLEGRIEIFKKKIVGKCADCGMWRGLDPDHRLKRSQGGSHKKENIDWICRECHILRDQKGDPMNKKETRTKKANWQTEHECANCKEKVRSLICNKCGKMSIK